MCDQAETPASLSKRQPVSDPEVTPSVKTNSDPVQPAVPAPVPLPEPDPALPSRDQEIVE